MPSLLRKALIALSLANLCFLSAWFILLNPSHYLYYMKRNDPSFMEFSALAVLILLLALCFWLLSLLLVRVESRSINIAARYVFLLVLCWPINAFIHDYLGVSSIVSFSRTRWILAVVTLGAVALMVAAYKWRDWFVRAGVVALLILSPLFFVNFVSANWMRMRKPASAEDFRDKGSATHHSRNANTPRIIWIVFDEFDANAAFINRAPDLKLSEFDRLRQQSIYATNAYPPHNQTIATMPALVSGELVASATQIWPNDLSLKTAKGEEVRWSSQTSVFTDTRKIGLTSGVMGWYHPYCRVLGDSVDWCDWTPAVLGVNSVLDELTFRGAVSIWMKTAAYRIPFIYRLLHRRDEEQHRRDHSEVFERTARSARLLLQEDLNLKLFHLPIPHEPGIYDATRQVLSTETGHGYLENLQLADKVLGELRKTLEEKGAWDETTVLVSSDHWWREGPMTNGRRDHRIPFILKIAGQKIATEYETPFNTVLTRELLLQILRGNLTSPIDVMTWIDRNSQLSESPFTASLP